MITSVSSYRGRWLGMFEEFISLSFYGEMRTRGYMRVVSERKDDQGNKKQEDSKITHAPTMSISRSLYASRPCKQNSKLKNKSQSEIWKEKFANTSKWYPVRIPTPSRSRHRYLLPIELLWFSLCGRWWRWRRKWR
jgi:hypothetical protein